MAALGMVHQDLELAAAVRAAVEGAEQLVAHRRHVEPKHVQRLVRLRVERQQPRRQLLQHRRRVRVVKLDVRRAAGRRRARAASCGAPTRTTATPATMKAAVVRETGPADALLVEKDFPVPEMKDGQRLLRLDFLLRIKSYFASVALKSIVYPKKMKML